MPLKFQLAKVATGDPPMWFTFIHRKAFLEFQETLAKKEFEYKFLFADAPYLLVKAEDEKALTHFGVGQDIARRVIETSLRTGMQLVCSWNKREQRLQLGLRTLRPRRGRS